MRNVLAAIYIYIIFFFTHEERGTPSLSCITINIIVKARNIIPISLNENGALENILNSF